MASLTIHQASFLYISLQSFIFSFFLLLSKGPKRQTNIILAGFLFTLGTQMAFMFAAQSNLKVSMNSPFVSVFGFLYGPLLYFYTRSLIYEEETLQNKDFLHFLPAFIMLFSALLEFGLHLWFGSLLYLSMIVYSIFSLRCIKRYQHIISQTQSLELEINLSWLKWFLMIFSLTFLIDIYQHFYSAIDIIPGVSMVQFLLILLVNGIFFWGLRQPIIFQGISYYEESIVRPNLIFDSSLEVVNTNIDRVIMHMKSESPFRDPKLSLNKLAKQLKITPRELSILINQQTGQNFVDFVNTFRIEQAKKRLLNPKENKETISEVMYEVGFQSKSAFNTAFKKKTGKTPSEFKKINYS